MSEIAKDHWDDWNGLFAYKIIELCAAIKGEEFPTDEIHNLVEYVYQAAWRHAVKHERERVAKIFDEYDGLSTDVHVIRSLILEEVPDDNQENR